LLCESDWLTDWLADWLWLLKALRLSFNDALLDLLNDCDLLWLMEPCCDRLCDFDWLWLRNALSDSFNDADRLLLSD